MALALKPENDPRWIKLQNGGTRCSLCKERHRGVFDIAFLAPDVWKGQLKFAEPETDEDWENFLMEDFCRINSDDYFIRCVVELPLRGLSGETFGYGVWCKVLEDDFIGYWNSFNDPDQGKLGSWCGRLANRIEGYPDTLETECSVKPQNGNSRPLVEFQDMEHALAVAQRDGITLDQLFEIYARRGHTFD